VQIISHRGFWLSPDERNTGDAFARSFDSGFGAEIDVRDLAGELVISHDPPLAGALTLAAVLEAHADAGFPGELAINVKADGLCAPLQAALADTPRWTAFDMSVPDAVQYVRAGAPILTRQSEHEPAPSLYAQSVGVWLDAFDGEWFTEELVREHLEAGKRVCLVSPELHGRSHTAAWRRWGEWDVRDHPGLAICTDHPLKAEEALG
jgi:glycerophosphoryl diester phosphodiesterase